MIMLWRRSGNPLQYSCLENPRDRGAWWAAIYGVAQSQTRLKRLSGSSSDYVFLPYCETGEGKLLPPSKDSQVVGYSQQTERWETYIALMHERRKKSDFQASLSLSNCLDFMM